jgi:mannose-6-phosphate isomerase-like protein (cupin superfamily)
MQAAPGEVVLPCADLTPTLRFFTGELGFRVEAIFPAEEPHTATISGHGLRLRLEPGRGDPGLIRIARAGLPGGPGPTAPNGTRIEWADPQPPLEIPSFVPAFIVTRAAEGPAAGEGRAGMIYRDLIPGRLGGKYIASSIAVPGSGPVADWVHFHRIAFQLIFCGKGRVRLVYEDQGPPFWMEAGDCVLQPPTIRHRVLESEGDLEVIEVTCPALHETLADHDLALPTGREAPQRDFGGQRYCFHRAAEAGWRDVGGGFEAQDTGLAGASAGMVSVRVLRGGDGARIAAPGHDGELLFGFVLEGGGTLHCRGGHALAAGDAFIIPPGEVWAIEAGAELRLLEVRSPA